MSYVKTNWVNNTTPINADNLNKIENELETLDTSLDEYTQYSSSEKVIGTWLNGKPVYRKCITLTSDNVNGASVSTGVNDLEDMVKMWGIWNGARPVPSASGVASYNIEMYYNSTDKKMYVITGSSIANALVRIYIEYTKSSD